MRYGALWCAVLVEWVFDGGWAGRGEGRVV